MTLAEVLRLSSAELERQGAGFALVGGLAVSARTEPRFTRDIDLAVAVARTGDLVALKLLARDDVDRPQDAADLRGLARASDADEWAVARAARDEIVSRGFNRGRDLAVLLESLLRS